MALREIITYPHKVLAEKARPVTEFDRKIQTVIEDMAETMYNGSGIGLAANQIGELRRIIVVDTSPTDPSNELIALINPEIIAAEGSVAMEEGCLSCLDFRAEIPRSEKVTVRALDRSGKPIELRAEGIQAIALQHEIDHLNGILIINHVSSLKRELYKRRIGKILRERHAQK